MPGSIRRALIISSIERYIVFGISVTTLAIVSRLLTPMEVGLAMLGTAVLGLSDSIRDFGTSSYLVQKADISKQEIRAAFTIILLITIILSVVLYSGAGILAAFYNSSDLAAYFKIIAIAICVTPFSGTAMALMRREMNFGTLAVINVLGQFAGAALTIALASLGYGFMSFAWAILGSNLIIASAAIQKQRDFQIFRPSFSNYATVMRFGWLSSATAVLNQVYAMFPLFIMGRVLPLDAVGLYGRAQSLCQLADKIVFTGVGPVVLPALSVEAREGRTALKDIYLAALSYITVVYWPLLGLLALLAHPVVDLVLGSQWSQVVPLVQIMAIAMLVFFPAVLTYPTLVAAGGVADALKASAISLPPSACLIWLAAQHGPLLVAASQLVTMPLQIFVALWFIQRRIGFQWMEVFSAIRSSAAVTAAALSGPAIMVLAHGSGDIGLMRGLACVAMAIITWFIAVFLADHRIRNECVDATSRIVFHLNRFISKKVERSSE